MYQTQQVIDGLKSEIEQFKTQIKKKDKDSQFISEDSRMVKDSFKRRNAKFRAPHSIFFCKLKLVYFYI